MITGTVRTNKQGSNSEFDIMPKEEWERLSDDAKDRELVKAMFESGVLDFYAND